MMNKIKLKKIMRDNFNIISSVLVVVIILSLSLWMNVGKDTSNKETATLSIKDNESMNKKENKTVSINDTDEDKNFKNWVYLSFRSIMYDVNCISKAAEKHNFSETERCGTLLRDNSNRSLGQIDTYNISSSLDEARSEYRQSLEYYNIGGLNLEIGAKNRDPQQMYNATVYIRNGSERMGRVVSLLGNETDKLALKIG